MLHQLIKKAYSVLNGAKLSREDALALAQNIRGNDLMDLLSLANKVHDKYAPGVKCCSILNAKSGVCSQNCRFCAQSAHHNTDIETYPQVDTATVLEAARKVYASGVRSFGYVTSGCGYLESNEEFQKILEALDALHENFPDMKLCVSIGILSRETAQILSKHHVGRYNMNLQTSPEKYSELISDTHTIKEKIDTIKYLQEFGVEICCGGIIGLGETMTDRIEMALAVRELDVEGIPLNVLIPIPGTPLEKQEPVSPAEVALTFALFRLLNPAKMIKFAAGRETRMKDFQALLMLSGANSMMTGGYLTTRGRSTDEDRIFVQQLKDFSSAAE